MTLRASPQTPSVDESVTFKAHADGDPIDTCAWDFTGDGTTDATGETAGHRFEHHGRHEVTATVTDTDGETVELTRAVSVCPPVQWTFEVGHRVRSSPTVMGGSVFLGSDDRSVYAIGAVSGETEWTFDTDGRVRSSPAVAGNTIFVGSEGGSVYALDGATGEQEWQFETGDAITSSPAVADGTVFVGSEDKNLYALDADSGEVNWQYSIVNPVDTSPTVAGNTVFLGNYNLYALDADSGEERWVFRAGGKIRSSPAVTGETVFVGGDVSGSNSAKVYAIDVTTGEQEWVAYTDGPVRSSPTAADGAVFLGDSDSNVYALDARSGERRWTAETGGSIEASPTVAEGTVLVGSLDGSVYALDEASGAQRWAVETDSSVVSSPAVAGGTVFAGSDDGRVYALETAVDGSSDGSRAVVDSPDDDGGQTSQTATPAQGDSGEYTATVSTDDDSVTESVSVSGSPSEAGDDTVAASTDSPVRGVETTVAGQTVEPLSEHQRVPDPAGLTTPSCDTLTYSDIEERAPIGSGGNADVYRATATLDGERADLALKRPRMSGTLHTDVVERMLEEARTWQRLDDHDHIVGVVDYGSEPLPWIGMEYMDGGHLGDRLAGMSAEQALWTAIATTTAVRHAHRRGVAHLDLKPENILFRSVENAWDVPKVADWGLSKHLLNHSKSVEGITTDYAAPEQFADGYGSPDDITDIYQLGAVFYELFTGRPPFEGKPMRVMRKIETEQPTPPSERAELPEGIDDILLTALAKDKADRYETVVHLRNDLQELW